MSDEIPKGVTFNSFSVSKDEKVHIKVYKDSIIHRVDFEIPVKPSENIADILFAVIEHHPGYWQPKEKEKADEN